MCAVILCWLVWSSIGREVSFGAVQLETQSAKQHKIKFWSIKWKKADIQGEAITRGVLRLQLRSADAPRLRVMVANALSDLLSLEILVRVNGWIEPWWKIGFDAYVLYYEFCDWLLINVMEREYLRLNVNVFSWMWGLSTVEVDSMNNFDWMWIFAIDCECIQLNVRLCTVEVDSTNNFDWTWIFAIDCECFQSNVRFVYSGSGFYEYFRLDVNICDWLWTYSVECEVCLQRKWILRIIPIGCEYLRSIVNISIWMWCLCTVELDFVNISDWMWISAIDCEYLQLNVMYVYIGSGFYECFRLDVNSFDRLWIFSVECDVYVQWNWILRIIPTRREYLRSNLIDVYSGSATHW